MTDIDEPGMIPAPAPDWTPPESPRDPEHRVAKFAIGESVEHRRFGFRGVIFDVDPEFANTEEWYQSIPAEVRPRKDQPFYHLFAVHPKDDSPYIAYVSEQNLVPLAEGEEVRHPSIAEYFNGKRNGQFQIPSDKMN